MKTSPGGYSHFELLRTIASYSIAKAKVRTIEQKHVEGSRPPFPEDWIRLLLVNWKWLQKVPHDCDD